MSKSKKSSLKAIKRLLDQHDHDYKQVERMCHTTISAYYGLCEKDREERIPIIWSQEHWMGTVIVIKERLPGFSVNGKPAYTASIFDILPIFAH